MKTLIQPLFLTLALTVTTAAAVLANPSSANRPVQPRPTRPAVAAAYKTGIYPTAEGKINIALDKEAGGVVTIRLANSAGREVYAERMGKAETRTRLRLDMAGMPDGAYQVVITNGVETTTYALTLGTPQPTMSNRLIAIN